MTDTTENGDIFKHGTEGKLAEAIAKKLYHDPHGATNRYVEFALFALPGESSGYRYNGPGTKVATKSTIKEVAVGDETYFVYTFTSVQNGDKSTARTVKVTFRSTTNEYEIQGGD